MPQQANIIRIKKSTFGNISKQVFIDTLLSKLSVGIRIIDLLITRIQVLTREVNSLKLEDVYNGVVCNS
jgi:hypothetical protein